MSETVEIQGYDQLRHRLAAISGDNLTKPLMHALAAQAVREQKLLLYSHVQRRTGQSGRNVVLGPVTATSARTVATGTAVYIDRGTREHDIYPKNKKALFFSAGGGGTRLTGSVSSRFRGAGGLAKAAKAGVDLVFAKHVHHPGTKAHPFMVEGARKAIESSGLAKRVVAAWEGRPIE